jgi:S1-C subfamily serine protease
VTSRGPASPSRTATRPSPPVVGLRREQFSRPAGDQGGGRARGRTAWRVVAGALVGTAGAALLGGLLWARPIRRAPDEATERRAQAAAPSSGPDEVIGSALERLAREESARLPAADAPAPAPAPSTSPKPTEHPRPEAAPAPRPKATIADVVERVGPSIVTVTTKDPTGRSLALGSGFLVSRWRVATNYHVVEGAGSAAVRFSDGTRMRVAGVLADDASADLAILELASEAVGRRPLALARATPRAGEAVFVIGSPLGFEQTVSDGRCSGLVDYPGRGLSLQVSAPISPGSSGGPVFDLAGEVVGVARFTRTDGQNVNFAVPILRLRALLDATPIGTSPRPFPSAPDPVVDPPAARAAPEARPPERAPPPAPAPLPPPPSLYAAIAFDSRTGQYGWSWNATTLAAAENLALEKVAGRHARVVVWVRDGWCALARSRDGAAGWAQGPTREYVVATALAACRSQTTAACYIALAFRADGSE